MDRSMDGAVPSPRPAGQAAAWLVSPRFRLRGRRLADTSHPTDVARFPAAGAKMSVRRCMPPARGGTRQWLEPETTKEGLKAIHVSGPGGKALPADA